MSISRQHKCMNSRNLLGFLSYYLSWKGTVNLEFFSRILFLRIELKDIFSIIKIRDLDMIYLHK